MLNSINSNEYEQFHSVSIKESERYNDSEKLFNIYRSLNNSFKTNEILRGRASGTEK